MKAQLWKTTGAIIDIEPENGKKKFSIEELQKFVGGYVDIQRLRKTHKILVSCDDGKLQGFEKNENASILWQAEYPIAEFPINNDGTIVGDVVVLEMGTNLI